MISLIIIYLQQGAVSIAHFIRRTPNVQDLGVVSADRVELFTQLVNYNR
jgi:hypothetical protein